MSPARICPIDDQSLAEAAALIRAGQCVAVPTETVYGLAADATDPAAVAGIYAAKGRPSFNPLIVHVADVAMARAIAQFDAQAERLADAFWPGPLTIVLPRRADGPICDLAAAGLATVALRLPDHPAMQGLIRASGRPLAAPSANRSGSISPTKAVHVAASLGDRIPLILDAGATRAGVESTIVAPGPAGLRLLRPGPITVEQLQDMGFAVIGGDNGTIEAPGQLSSHYCPDKPLRLNAVAPLPGEYFIGFGPGGCDFTLSRSGDLVEAAANIFAALHMADASDRPAIAVARIAGEGIGVAINDRLARAAVR